MKKIAILGSTGSIGTQTLEVVRNNPELQVAALAAGKSVEQMEQQIREFHPLIAGMWSEEAAADLRSRVADLPVKFLYIINTFCKSPSQDQCRRKQLSNLRNHHCRCKCLSQ